MSQYLPVQQTDPQYQSYENTIGYQEKLQNPERIKSNSENLVEKISTNENAGMSEDSEGGKAAHVELDIYCTNVTHLHFGTLPSCRLGPSKR
jgi:hypothetical protein